MNYSSHRVTTMILELNRLRIFTVAVICIGIVGCFGDKAVRPEDTEKQAFDDLRVSVQNVVADQQRQEAAIGVVNRLETDYQELREALIRRRADLRRLHADYDATTESLIDFANSVERKIQGHQQRVSRTHQELISATTPDEWSLLIKTDTKAMNALSNSLQGI